MKAYGPTLLFVILSSLPNLAQTSAHPDAGEFVIDNTKPYVYLLFDHWAKGVRSADDDSEIRYWFRLVNNCRVPIRVSTSGVPKGRPADEIGLIYAVVENQSRGVEVIAEAAPLPGDKPQQPPTNEKGALRVPLSNVSHLSSVDVIPPKGSLLFSIPANHLGVNWHIEITYEFDTPHGSGPRAEDVGGHAVMTLIYDDVDLPDYVRQDPSAKP